MLFLLILFVAPIITADEWGDYVESRRKQDEIGRKFISRMLARIGKESVVVCPTCASVLTSRCSLCRSAVRSAQLISTVDKASPAMKLMFKKSSDKCKERDITLAERITCEAQRATVINYMVGLEPRDPYGICIELDYC
ncbi:unnamed protein product [Calicophoron daubneyi]|uniref:Uncharacterized protein n=1 Tax=Calicophoron daubneyi TaxID=300641 RepID=A0AAV2TLL2_CALDB